MTRHEARKWIDDVVASYNDMSRVFDSANTLIGLAVDSPFGEACWKAFDVLLDATAAVLIDDSERLHWYVFENECGGKALQHSLPGGTMRVVANTDDLLDVMGF